MGGRVWKTREEQTMPFILKSTEIFDIETETWSPGPDLPSMLPMSSLHFYIFKKSAVCVHFWKNELFVYINIYTKLTLLFCLQFWEKCQLFVYNLESLR